MKTRSKKTNTLDTPKRGTNDVKLKTPKQERKKDVDTPLRVEDLRCSQHFGSQIDVTWECNSPDALRNLQRYRGENDTEVSEIVMQLLNEEPPDHQSQDFNRISPPLTGLWRTTKGTADSLRPQRKLRARKKSGEELLVDTLRDALRKCEETDEPKSCNVQEATSIGPLAEDQAVEEADHLLNNSKDLFESTKVNSLNDETVKSDDCEKLDKSDATWSDDELFEEDSFIIKATQFPETIKSFNSPVFGVKRKQPGDCMPNRTKSPRYSFQLDVKTNRVGNKVDNVSVIKTRAAASVSGVVGKPPKGPAASARSLSACDSKTKQIQNSADTYQTSKTSCATDMTHTCTMAPTKDITVGSMSVKTRSFTNSYKSSVDSGNSSKHLSLNNSKMPNLPNSAKIISGTGNLNVEFKTEPTQKFSSFKKHNSFNGSENVTASLSRQRSYSGSNKSGETYGTDLNIPSSTSVTSVKTSVSLTRNSNKVLNFDSQALSKAGACANSSSVVSSYTRGVTSTATSTGRNSAVVNKPVNASSIGVMGLISSKTNPVTVPSQKITKTISSCVATSSTCTSSASQVGFVGMKPSLSRPSSSIALGKPLSTTSSTSVKESSAKPTLNRPSSSIALGKSLSTTSSATSKESAAKLSLSRPGSLTALGNSTTSSATSKESSAKLSYRKPNSLSALGKSTTSSVSLKDSSPVSTEVKMTSVETGEDSFKDSPVFVPKKRLSASAFDTSLSDDLLCQLAEPDDLLETQTCKTAADVKKGQTISTKSSTFKSGDHIPNTVTKTSIVPLFKTEASALKGSSSIKQNSDNKDKMNVPNKGNERKAYTFKSSQMQISNNINKDSGVQKEDKQKANVGSNIFKEPLKCPEKTATLAKIPPPVVGNEYSEDLFLSDDDDFLDDGLTEPEILAMLDEVEFLATQQLKASPDANNPRSSQGQTCTPTKSPGASPIKYSPSDIERKKQEAIKKRQLSSSQELKVQGHSPLSPTKYSPSDKGWDDSQCQGTSPIKYSPWDIERKRQEAIKRRQLSSSQELKGEGHSPVKMQPLSEKIHDDLEKCFDDSQGSMSSPTKYSPSDIERKRQEAVKRRLLSSSQESNNQGHNNNKLQPYSIELDFNKGGLDRLDNSESKNTNHKVCSLKNEQPSVHQKLKDEKFSSKEDLTNLGQSSSQGNSKTGASSSQGQSSPIKCSQTDIERKKQEALKRRKLRLQTKGK